MGVVKVVAVMNLVDVAESNRVVALVLVMCMARPQAKSQAKPGQAQPKSRPAHGFGLAWGLSKPKPSCQATALCHVCDSFEITQFNSFLPQPVWDIA